MTGPTPKFYAVSIFRKVLEEAKKRAKDASPSLHCLVDSVHILLDRLFPTVHPIKCKRMNSKQTPRSSILRKSSGELSASSRRSFASTSTHTSSVSFDHVTVREYEVTIGDNPSCSSGAPIR